MNKLFHQLIVDGDILINYMESPEGDPYLDIEYVKDGIKESIDEEAFTLYVADCFVVASFAGFEPPTEYYQAMKAFVSDKTVMDAANDFTNSLLEQNND